MRLAEIIIATVTGNLSLTESTARTESRARDTATKSEHKPLVDFHQASDQQATTSRFLVPLLYQLAHQGFKPAHDPTYAVILKSQKSSGMIG